jgi:hypothetical protein
MGWRFRRSVKILPGVRWNISSGGSSWSFGTRGFTVNVGRRGVRTTMSIPGTGLSHTRLLRSSTGRSSVGTPPPLPSPDPDHRSDLPTVAEPVSISPLSDEAAAVVCRTWAIGRFGWLGRLLPRGVTEIERHPVERVLAWYNVRTRDVVVATSPLPRKTSPTGGVPDPAALDPWDTNAHAKAAATQVIAQCPTCVGTGRCICRECGGTVDVACAECGASGTEVSSRSGRLVNCRSCRGTGRRRCPCRDGLVVCEACSGKTVATVWLVVREVGRVEFRAAGTPEFSVSRPDAEISANVQRLESLTTAAGEGPPASLGPLESTPLEFKPDPRSERVTAASFVRDVSETVAVGYELAGHSGALTIEAWSGRLRADESSEVPFRAVRRRLWSASAILMILGFGLCGWFASRHWYYAQSPEALGLLLLAPALAACGSLPMFHASLPASRVGWTSLATRLLPCLAVLATQAWLSAAAPSVERAERLAAAGQNGRALRESLAAAELGVDPTRAKALHDRIQRDVLIAGADADMWPRLAGSQFLTDAGRAGAEDVAVERTASTAQGFEARGDYQASLRVLAAVPPRLKKRPAIHEREHAARLLELGALWLTVSTNGPSERKVSACQAMGVPLAALSGAAKLPAPRSQLESTCASIVRADSNRIRREQESRRQADLRAARQRLAQEQREAQRVRSAAVAPLLCRDGSLSPSCVCGGSRRGCCSHHGGVAGCSQ